MKECFKKRDTFILRAREEEGSISDLLAKFMLLAKKQSVFRRTKFKMCVS